MSLKKKINRTLMTASGLAGGLITGQIPNYTKNYVQTLDYQIKNLQEQTEKTTKEKTKDELIAKKVEKTKDLEAITKKPEGLERTLALMTHYDFETHYQTIQQYEPAIPLTKTGAEHFGIGVMLGIMTYVMIKRGIRKAYQALRRI